MKVRIEIPLPMPTWNRILAMHPWERKKLRDLMHHAVSLSITYGADWPIWTEFQSKRVSTDLFTEMYLQTIRPSKSRKSTIDKLKASQKPPSSKSKK